MTDDKVWMLLTVLLLIVGAGLVVASIVLGLTQGAVIPCAG